jgi:hypothetical protein
MIIDIDLIMLIGLLVVVFVIVMLDTTQDKEE